MRRHLALVAALAATLPPTAPAEEPPPAPPSLPEVLAAAPAEAWRPLDPAHTVLFELPGGRVVIELAPAFAPLHVANVEKLVAQGYFDGLAVVRSQENYVVQWGDPLAGEEGARSFGEARRSLPAELERPITPGLGFTPVPDGDVYAPEAGFSRGLPVGRDPARDRVWLAHCNGMVGAGRGEAADSGSGAELYVVIGHAPRHLDRNVTLLGRVVQGMEVLSTLPRGTGPLGFYEDPARHVPIYRARLAADLPADQRPRLEVLRTDTPTFEAVIAARRHRRESWFLDPVGRIELCNVPLPVREAPAPAVPAVPADDLASACPQQAALLAAIDGLLAGRPEDATLHYFRARALATCGQAAPAAAALAAVRRHGDGFLATPELGFAAVVDHPAIQQEMDAMAAALPQVVDAEVVHRVTGPALIPEGIAFDAATDRLFLGSLAEGTIVVLGADGSQGVFAGPFAGLGQILGLAVDAPRGRLLAVATNVLGPREEAANAVLELDLADGSLRRRLPAPGAGQLNDVAVAPDGTVFATDSALGGLWRAPAGAAALERWLPEVTLGGANGLAVSSDGTDLYVAHATGIAHLDVVSGTLTPRLANATRESLAAIDGLYLAGDHLVGIQNVTNPGRVIAAELAPSGREVVAVRTLLSHHHPELAEPTTGAVAGDRFLVLANSFVGRLAADGTIADRGSLRDPVVLAVPLPLP